MEWGYDSEGIVMSGRRPPIKGYFRRRGSWVRSCLRPFCAENRIRRP